MQGILTAGLADRAFQMVRPLIEATLNGGYTEGKNLVVVVTAVAAINPPEDGKSFEDNCLLIHEFGDPASYTGPFRKVAVSKAEISARLGLSTANVAPQYLLDGDTVNSGSAVLDGIVVAASGDRGFFDEMFSYWVAAAIQARCKKKFADLKDKDADFVQ